MQSILVVDDDVAACMVIRRMVQLFGFECDMVHNGEDALKAAFTKTYSIILMDSFMPIKNGWEAALEIKSLKTLQQLNKSPCIVAMMSLDEISSRRGWKAAGLDSVLFKPVNRAQLQETIYHILRSTKSE
jgi:CheY-like chemotaxis protein